MTLGRGPAGVRLPRTPRGLMCGDCGVTLRGSVVRRRTHGLVHAGTCESDPVLTGGRWAPTRHGIRRWAPLV